jgi:hypothetical protein
MRRFTTMVILVASFAVLATAQAAPAKTTKINATLVGNGCVAPTVECGHGGGGSCVCFVAYWSFDGRAVISPLGALDFAGFYQDGYFCSDIANDFSCLVPLDYTRSLTLTLTARNGDKLVLVENFSSTTPFPLLSTGDNPVGGEWSVDPAQSTGRFSRYTGSGTYSLNLDPHDTYYTFTLTLQGTLSWKRVRLQA